MYPVWLLLLSVVAGMLLPHTTVAASCTEWVAQIVSVQGTAQARREGELHWQPAELHALYCPGDTLRVLDNSRVAMVLRNQTVLRLDQKTTLTFPSGEKEPAFLLDLLSGAAYFFSRIPHTLKVLTPFVNAGIEGTEFLVQVAPDHTVLVLFAGRVAVTNAAGSLTLAPGQSAVARAGQAPALHIVVHLQDTV